MNDSALPNDDSVVRARIKRPQRDQIQWRDASLDQLIPRDHRVRATALPSDEAGEEGRADGDRRRHRPRAPGVRGRLGQPEAKPEQPRIGIGERVAPAHEASLEKVPEVGFEPTRPRKDSGF